MTTRVCIVAENHPQVLMGGAEYQTHLLAEELGRRQGVDVHYLARRVPTKPDPALPYAVRSIGNSAGIRRRAVFFDVPALSRALWEIRPDVIYQQMKQSYSAVCSHFARRTQVPFFMHMASEWDVDPTWFPFHFSANTPFDMIEAVTGNWGLRHASHLIAQTPAQDQKLRDRFARPASLIVRNFQPLPSSISDRPPGPVRVLWVGNLKAVKRPELYVQLAQSFSGRTDIHFDMVGRPWQHRHAEPLMKQIAATSNLTYHGELSIDRVNQMMSAASLYVNTSAHEGFPNTFIQAWAHGAVLTSIVVDPVDGMDKLGIGFCTGTLERMSQVIDELVLQPARRKEVAASGFNYVQQNHSLKEGARLADAMLDAARSSAVRKA